jgi:hypothetical protein
MLTVSLLVLAATFASAEAGSALSGEEVARLIGERPNDDLRTGEIAFEIVDGRGRSRERAAKLAVGTVEDSHRIVLAFTRPSTIRDTAFLSHNHDDPQATDETWLFLPATDLVRRMPASDLADSFIGTELSYGDVADDFKFGLDDYEFEASAGEGGSVILTGVASSPARAKELGYSGFSAVVDPKTWFPMQITFNDTRNKPLKTIVVDEISEVGRSYAAVRFHVENLQTGKRTNVTVTGLSPAPELPERTFDPAWLDRIGSQL